VGIVWVVLLGWSGVGWGFGGSIDRRCIPPPGPPPFNTTHDTS
jgi:hypothetical protein